MALAVLLTGCGNGEETHLRAVQSSYGRLASLQMEAEITFHLAESYRTFTVSCTQDEEGATTTVTAPEELRGISATVRGDELLLRYEGAALPAGKADVLSPALCIPWLVRSVAEGYLLEWGHELIDGMECLRAVFDTTAPDGQKITCTVWWQGESTTPLYTEFAMDGTVVLTMRTLQFQMEENREEIEE